MKNASRGSIVVLFIALGRLTGAAVMQNAHLQSELQSLVRSELAFAKAAADVGVRDAFLTFLAADAVVFRPAPVDGRKFYAEMPAQKGRLSWYPVVADISRTADLGYTTGPYELHSGNETQPVVHGNYVSLWRKGPDGIWKVVLDTGTSNPPPKVAPEPWRPVLDQYPSSANQQAIRNPSVERNSLMEADRAFSADSQARRIAAAYADRLVEQARLLRPNSVPLEGKSAIVASLAPRKEAWTWEPMEAVVSKGSDLGYTYGKMAVRTRAAAASSIRTLYYTRIWKRNADGAWRLALEVANAG